MAFIRRDYWIPRLRRLTKKVIRGCFGCEKFQVTAFHSPPPGNLLIDRTMGSVPFQVMGVDYAGPIPYKISQKRDGKAHIVLFACSLTRAIHQKLEAIHSKKRKTTKGVFRQREKFRCCSEMVERYHEGREDAGLPGTPANHMAN